MKPFATIPEAIEEMRAGRILVVVDDEDRENEGDLTMAAECITPEAINFMATHGRGLICLALTPNAATPCIFRWCRLTTLRASERLSVNPSTHSRRDHRNFGGRPGPHHSRAMRPDAETVRSGASRPCFPLRAREGGVLVRAGQTEAAVDLARMAGFEPGGVICEIMNDDGTMARVPQLTSSARSTGSR